jgi:hypothetical protein
MFKVSKEETLKNLNAQDNANYLARPGGYKEINRPDNTIKVSQESSNTDYYKLIKLPETP